MLPHICIDSRACPPNLRASGIVRSHACNRSACPGYIRTEISIVALRCIVSNTPMSCLYYRLQYPSEMLKYVVCYHCLFVTDFIRVSCEDIQHVLNRVKISRGPTQIGGQNRVMCRPTSFLGNRNTPRFNTNQQFLHIEPNVKIEGMDDQVDDIT